MTNTNEQPSVAETSEPATQALDDVLLAMDVVDTLRHREQMVARELDEEGREAELLDRLKEIYQAQGITVPERILKDGVAALKEKRFAYTPPKNSLSVRLARIYISRDRWLKPVILSATALIAAAGAYEFGVAGPERGRVEQAQIELTQTLPNRLRTLRTDIQELSTDREADALAETLYQDGLSALEDNDPDSAQVLIDDLESLQADLTRTYEVRVRYGDGAQSGVFRIPDDQPGQRNYYLIVEAVDPRGNILEVPVFDEENQVRRRAKQWGQRVSENVFNRVAADKRDDQIIQNDVIGEKPIGRLMPIYSVETPGGAIVEW
ncbi:MAG: DUF6384 family protein [Pseudomonadota bacterium]